MHIYNNYMINYTTVYPETENNNVIAHNKIKKLEVHCLPWLSVVVAIVVVALVVGLGGTMATTHSSSFSSVILVDIVKWYSGRCYRHKK